MKKKKKKKKKKRKKKKKKKKKKKRYMDILDEINACKSDVRNHVKTYM